MKYTYYVIVFAIGSALGFLMNPKPEPIIVEPIILTNIDTIYQDIEILKLEQDTIKLYYEKKIYIYTTLNTTERVELFSERINR